MTRYLWNNVRTWHFVWSTQWLSNPHKIRLMLFLLTLQPIMVPPTTTFPPCTLPCKKLNLCSISTHILLSLFPSHKMAFPYSVWIIPTLLSNHSLQKAFLKWSCSGVWPRSSVCHFLWAPLCHRAHYAACSYPLGFLRWQAQCAVYHHIHRH